MPCSPRQEGDTRKQTIMPCTGDEKTHLAETIIIEVDDDETPSVAPYRVKIPSRHGMEEPGIKGQIEEQGNDSSIFFPFSSVFLQDEIIKMRNREIAILRETESEVVKQKAS